MLETLLPRQPLRRRIGVRRKQRLTWMLQRLLLMPQMAERQLRRLLAHSPCEDARESAPQQRQAGR